MSEPGDPGDRHTVLIVAATVLVMVAVWLACVALAVFLPPVEPGGAPISPPRGNHTSSEK